ncbi:MAG: YHYH protein [Phototrophicaceae bacterium]
MTQSIKFNVGVLLLAFIIAIVGVNISAQTDSDSDDHSHDESTHTHAEDGSVITSIDPSLFLEDGLASDISEEACTLSGGTETTCYRIEVYSVPTDHEAGPWCPRTITDSAEEGGIWFEDGIVYDLDGEFIENLDTFYNDENWLLYNEDGTINVTDTVEAFEAAARPNVDPAYQNHCVEGQLEWLEDGATLVTYIIPTEPFMLENSQDLNGNVIGISLNGVNFDPPAPTAQILAAYTIAALDDCGGHINPVTGYHYHAHTGCTAEIAQADGHAPLIGFALDGIPMYSLYDVDGNEASDLDECGGQYDDVRGYHYHVADAGSNMTLGCFSGEIGCSYNGSVADLCDASASEDDRGGPPDGGNDQGAPDLANAAEILGVSEDDLRDALGDERPPNFAAAAETLGISEDAIRDALGTP